MRASIFSAQKRSNSKSPSSIKMILSPSLPNNVPLGLDVKERDDMIEFDSLRDSWMEEEQVKIDQAVLCAKMEQTFKKKM